LFPCNDAIAGPSTQTDVAVSAEGMNTTVTFEAGTSAPNSISIPFGINDDEVGLEAVEMYTVTFEILALTNLVQPGMPMEAIINIIEVDRKSIMNCVVASINSQHNYYVTKYDVGPRKHIPPLYLLGTREYSDQ
jgi:hypothetical protein